MIQLFSLLSCKEQIDASKFATIILNQSLSKQAIQPHLFSFTESDSYRLSNLKANDFSVLWAIQPQKLKQEVKAYLA